jgi:H+/Cl- antiporter ClcA
MTHLLGYRKMTQSEFFALYLASLGVIGGLSGFVITHLLAEIKRLHARVDEIYNILLDR